MKKIKIAAAFKDTRGAIYDLIENEEINAVTAITFKKGAVRANHLHKKTYQWNYVLSGKILLVTKKKGKPAERATMKKGDFIVTVPGEEHALKAIEASELMVFTKGPRGGKEYESDTFRLETPLIKA